MTRSALLAAPVAALMVGLAAPAFAANADHPYANVDKRNDSGNATGDSQVDSLNRGQLDGNYKGPVELRTPSGSSAAGAGSAPASGAATPSTAAKP